MNNNYIRKDLLTELSKKDKIKYREFSKIFRTGISSYNFVLFSLFCAGIIKLYFNITTTTSISY